MDGDGVGVLDVLQQRSVVFGDTAVEAERHPVAARCDFEDAAHIAVEHAAALRAVFAPFDVVIVARLHDLVSFTEDDCAVFFLALPRVRRVERSLQEPVQLERTQLSLPRGGDDLNVVLG